MSLPPRGSSFKVTQKFKPTYCNAVFTQYESQKTGLRVTTVDSEGPKVYGYFALATEIHNDSGAPHTLEHLIFMGSRNYKYKGFLDKLATRAYSDTNAWTATDHTVYTLSTAGWDGFNLMLPVYLDHVITPTLTDSACYTEVHHIDGEGQDAGVVYSEMQGRENTQYDLIEVKLNRLIYPERSGFHFETGGLMDRLRVLTADQIRAFHKEMYQPKNLNVIVIGAIDHTQLLQTLDTFEDTLVGHVPLFNEPFERPWMKNGKVPPLEESITEIVEFPEEDESHGQLVISFLGPDGNDIVATAAVDVLLAYAADSSVSFVNNILVEQEHLASIVYTESESRPDLLSTFYIEGVKTGELEGVRKRFLALLRDEVSKPLDMAYLVDCLERTVRQVRSIAERLPPNFANQLINDHLFGDRDGSTLLQNLQNLEEYVELSQWTEYQWRQFFKKWFVDCHHVCIVGKPSMKLSETLQKDEEERVKVQKNQLGETGLQKLEKKLENAKADNEQQVPDELIRRFEPPAVDSIRFIGTQSAASGSARNSQAYDTDAQRFVDGDNFPSPLFIHFESIPSNFVRLGLTICTHEIPEEQRPLLLVYLSSFFDTPVMRNGRRIEFEQVTTQLRKDTINYEAESTTENDEMLTFRFVLESDKYEKIISWLSQLLLDRVFDETRLITTVTKLLADVPEEKRSGYDMAAAVSEMLLLTRKSTQRVFNALAKNLYLRKTLKQLQTDPKSVLKRMRALQTVINNPSNMRFDVVANLEGSSPLPSPAVSFKPFSDRLGPWKGDMTPIDQPRAGLSNYGRMLDHFAYIIPMRTLDSSFAVLSTRGVESLASSNYPALCVAQAYLDAVEGPLWAAIRGSGLAYGTGFRIVPDLGLLRFRIYRSPDAFKAFTATKNIVGDIASGKVGVDQLAFEGALSNVVVNMVDAQPHMNDAADMAFAYEAIRGIGKDWPHKFMRRARGVTPEEMTAAMRDIMMPLFDSKQANLVVTCAHTLEAKLSDGFRDHGFDLKSRSLNSFEDDYDLEGDFDEEEEDDDDDDDEDNDDEDDDDEKEDDGEKGDENENWMGP